MFLELAEILSDNIADTKMSFITWIIIVLIGVSIAVTITEVGLRFGILERGKQDRDKYRPTADITTRNWSRSDFSPPQLQAICGAEFVGSTFDQAQ